MRLALGLGVSLIALWLALVAALLVRRPSTAQIGEALRLLPDTLRLIRRTASDPAVPRRTRVRLWLVLAYLASPLDIVPDVIPVVGYADDAIIIAWTLRSVVRRAGPEALERNWPGGEEGLATIRRVAGA
ncbi:MAG: YkvA family protein [Gaiellales bacterium]